jgi:hypothetical protein
MERKKFLNLVGAGSVGVAAFYDSAGSAAFGNNEDYSKTTEPGRRYMKVGCQRRNNKSGFKARCGGSI